MELQMLKKGTREIKQRRGGQKRFKNKNKRALRIADMNVKFSLPANAIKLTSIKSLHSKFLSDSSQPKIAARFPQRHANSPWDNPGTLGASYRTRRNFPQIEREDTSQSILSCFRDTLISPWGCCVCERYMRWGWSVCCQYMCDWKRLGGLIERAIANIKGMKSSWRGKFWSFLMKNSIFA